MKDETILTEKQFNAFMERAMKFGGKKQILMPRGIFKSSMGAYQLFKKYYELIPQDPLLPHLRDLFEEAEGADLKATPSQEP